MRSHDQHLDVAQKPCKRKPSSREKFKESLAQSPWPKVTIFNDKMPQGQFDDGEKSLPSEFNECSTDIGASDSNVLTCDIVELFCENDGANHMMLEERTTCTQISSSMELEEDTIDVCSTCKDCTECQLQNNAAKMRETGDLMDERDQKHLDYYETEVNETVSMSSTVTSIDCETPILVDLTNEESKTSWKQTILKRFVDDKSSEMSEPCIMIADSSSRLQRSGTGGSLATALRDRGPCVIPVQPNPSLPIRPAPPTPTRSAASIVMSKKTCSPILKLPKSASFDVVELQSEKSLCDTGELSPSFEQQDGKSDDMMLTSKFIHHTNSILPDMANVVQITQEVNSVKRKSSEDRGREYKKEITKDAKKRRKSHEVDPICDERVENILKEYSRACANNLDVKEDRRPQHVMSGLWNDKRLSVVVSTTEPELKKRKEICNKVPPLRLKKVVREASTTNEYRNVTVNAESGNELNYCIVTGATPCPESPPEYSFWSSVTAEKDADKPILQNKSRRSSKSDGYKIKYRRNRLRQKLQELRAKALKLSHEMAVRSNDTDTQRNTRLRQMMNCYEKQIENVSKLLCKLSASIPPTSADDVVDLDYENELNEDHAVERAAVDSDSDAVQMVNGVSVAKQPTNISLLPSPESPKMSPGPPKLSPRSPVDYEKSKSPDKMRDSPPVLPRVYIAIQPTILECMKQNLVTANSWHESSDSSSDSSVEKEIKILDDRDRTITCSGVTTEPAITPVSSSEFEDPENGTAEWDTENTSPKLSPTLKDLEIEEKIEEITKTFEVDDVNEPRRSTPSIRSNDFLGTMMNIEIDVGNTGDTKESAAVQGCLDEILTQAVETQAANKQVAQEEQKKKQEQSRSSEALSTSSPILGEAKKSTEHYDSEERVNDESRTVASTSTTAQEVPTVVGRPQMATSNVNNILQLQSNYYDPSVPQGNMITDVIQNVTNTQKVTSSVSQSVTSNPTIPLIFTQSGSTVSSSSCHQQCVVLPNSCNKDVVPEGAGQRNEGNRIMTEQFPTLGNWVTRLSKKQATKSKCKLKSGVTLPTTSTAEAARVPGLETQKVHVSVPNNTTRSNIVNVAPQWNTERWQHRQRQWQKQLYDTASSTVPAVRPGICPPISVTQFYPPNYAIDPYGNGAAFGYQTTMCPYGEYTYHSRLHTAAPPAIGGYQLPLQDPSSMRQVQNIEKRFHLQEVTRHFADILKYPPTLSTAGNYQRTAAGLDFDRLRPAATVTQNGSTASAACLPPLLLPPSAPLPATAQQTSRTAPLAGYSSSTNQCGRNRMIPDVVAAAAAAAVVAAASFGQQRGPLPPYGRTDTEIVSGGMIDNEATQLMMNRTASRERLPDQMQSVASSVGVNSQLNNGSYHQLENLILNRLPYVKTDDAYSQRTIFSDNGQEMVASSVSSSMFKSNAMSALNALISREAVRKESRNCDTPHLGKINRTLETMSNLKCSNCGMTGSMFKCLGCEAAFYCDERCQIRHWNIHVEKCPKRMPKLKKLI